MSSINEVNQGLDILSVFQVDKSVASDKTVWISRYHDFIDANEVFAEKLQLVLMCVIWNVHQIHTLVKQCWVKSVRRFILTDEWSCVTNQIIHGSIVKVLNCGSRLLLRVELHDSFTSVLAQIVFYQLNLVYLADSSKSGVDLVGVPVVGQVGDEDLVGEESHL